ncbi:hypothetical protein Pfo_024279 [Paulownia fortunei]|nr:hypothetical protein Pfo_024279 [Paulownia fortunei]
MGNKISRPRRFSSSSSSSFDDHACPQPPHCTHHHPCCTPPHHHAPVAENHTPPTPQLLCQLDRKFSRNDNYQTLYQPQNMIKMYSVPIQMQVFEMDMKKVLKEDTGSKLLNFEFRVQHHLHLL